MTTVYTKPRQITPTFLRAGDQMAIYAGTACIVANLKSMKSAERADALEWLTVHEVGVTETRTEPLTDEAYRVTRFTFTNGTEKWLDVDQFIVIREAVEVAELIIA